MTCSTNHEPRKTGIPDNNGRVPAQQGIQGNETADRLAKQGIIKGENVNKEMDIKETKSVIKTHIAENRKVQWNNSNGRLEY